MHGNNLSLGRNHSTADNAKIVDWSDCSVVWLTWDDGAYVYITYDHRRDAVTHLNNLGFFPSK